MFLYLILVVIVAIFLAILIFEPRKKVTIQQENVIPLLSDLPDVNTLEPCYDPWFSRKYNTWYNPINNTTLSLYKSDSVVAKDGKNFVYQLSQGKVGCITTF